MANKLGVEIRRETDAGGRVSAIEVSWFEQRRWAIWLYGIFVTPCLIALPVAGLLSFGPRAHEGPIAALGIAAAVFVATNVVLTPFLARKRAIAFAASGEVRCPFGVPGATAFRYLHLDQARIRSIEAESAGQYGHAVYVYTADGDAWVLGHHMTQPVALKVATQLTSALREIRQAEAPQARRRPAMID